MASTPVNTSNVHAGGTVSNYRGPLYLLTTLFFMWGFITCLNDILIPHLKALFDLNYTKTMLIQLTFFGAYALMSMPAGFVIGRIGYKQGIVLGLVVTAVGALGFYPASIVISYGLFLGSLFVLATGITILQVAANPYVAILGPSESASGRLNMTQAFNSLGTTIAPVFGGILILSGSATGAAEKASAVQLPYIGIAVVLLAIAAVFALAKLPEIKAGGEGAIATGSAWQYRHLVLGAIAIFVYVGTEVSIGSFLINFFGLPEIGGLHEADASKYVALYWGGAMIGRFFGAISLTHFSKPENRYVLYGGILVGSFGLAYFLTKDLHLASLFLIFVAVNLVGFFIGKNRPNRTLAILAGAASLLVLVTVSTTGHFAMWPIIAVGLFNSIMFPTIFTLAIDDLGPHTSQASGILCMAIVGGAVLPFIMGMLADHFGVHHAFVLPMLGYLYILFYGVKGYKKIAN